MTPFLVWLMGSLVLNEGSSANPFSPREDFFVGRSASNLRYEDPNGRMVPLIDSHSNLPIIVHPFYARCKLTCSTIGMALKESLRKLGKIGVDYRVVSLSFDPRDTAADLTRYGDQLALPPEWELARASEPDVRAFLESIDFRILPNADDFIHGSWVVVLSPQGAIIDYVYGLDFNPTEFRKALGIFGWDRVATHPLTIWIFLFGVFSIASSFIWRGLKKPHHGN